MTEQLLICLIIKFNFASILNNTHVMTKSHNMPLSSNQIFSLLTIYILSVEGKNILLRHRYQRLDSKIKSKKKKIKKQITSLKSRLMFNVLNHRLLIIFCRLIIILYI